ncbi:MAG: hypothetical protein BWY66_00589 [bacterium ADurb.Bin374]|nr:MAG: hypothetical protein BWY66_00589 [bacterium ADurb.Bin374]
MNWGMTRMILPGYPAFTVMSTLTFSGTTFTPSMISPDVASNTTGQLSLTEFLALLSVMATCATAIRSITSFGPSTVTRLGVRFGISERNPSSVCPFTSAEISNSRRMRGSPVTSIWAGLIDTIVRPGGVVTLRGSMAEPGRSE